MRSGMLRLIIEDDEGGTSTLPLDNPEVSIGRKEENLLHLPERNVSRQHARLLQENEAFFIEDLDSYNGVRVNGERITRRVRITKEDLIEIGDYRLVIRDDGDTAMEPESVSQTSEDTPPAFQVVDGPTAVGPAPQPPPAISEATPSLPPPPVPGANAAPPPPPAAPENLAPPPPPAAPEKPAPAQAPATLPAPAPPPVMPPEAPQPAAPTPARAEVSRTALSTADTAVVRISDTARRAQPADDVEVERVPLPPGKLVCLAPPFEGKIFPLDRAEMVLGRSRENEIPLDHRSVEDRHAKVIYQHGTYSVVDLGSTEGIKVNDEPYRMISLRRGDILTVGLLRFRFVAPGEDFTFVPGIEEAERFVETAAARRMGLPVLLGLIAGIVVLLAIVAVFLFGGDRTTEGQPPPPVETKPEPPSVAPKPPTPPPGPDRAALAAEIRESLERGKKALGDENWTLAMASFKSVLEKDPASKEARTLLDSAAAEQGNSAHFEECRKLFASQDYARAFEACKAIPEDSRYSARAAGLMPKIQKGYVRKHLAAAKQAFRRGDMTKAQEETEAVFIFDAENQTAKKLKQRIEDSHKKGSTRTAKATKTVKPPKPPKPRAGRGGRPKGKGGSREQAKKLYVEATKYHQSGKLERAIEMYRKAVKLDPSFAYAYRGLGIAYASLGNGKMACRMYRKYLQVAPSAPDRGQVQTILQGCQN